MTMTGGLLLCEPWINLQKQTRTVGPETSTSAGIVRMDCICQQAGASPVEPQTHGHRPTIVGNHRQLLSTNDTDISGASAVELLVEIYSQQLYSSQALCWF